jgi:hypothetical protein
MIPAGRIPIGRNSHTQLGVYVLLKTRVTTSLFVPQILQTASVSATWFPVCFAVASYSLPEGVLEVTSPVRADPHRLHTDTLSGLTNPHCLHFELVIPQRIVHGLKHYG